MIYCATKLRNDFEEMQILKEKKKKKKSRIKNSFKLINNMKADIKETENESWKEFSSDQLSQRKNT